MRRDCGNSVEGPSWRSSYSHFVSLLLACNMSATAELGQKEKKRDDDLSGTLYVLKLTSNAVCPHSYTSTRNLGVTPML